MPTSEIRREEWSEFFKSFSRIHEGWLCTMEVLSPAIGAQVEARELPFASVSADRGPSEPPIRIVLGTSTGAHVSHAVEAPEHVYLKRSVEGADETLEIESGNMKTLITFRVAALPDTVDDVAERGASR